MLNQQDTRLEAAKLLPFDRPGRLSPRCDVSSIPALQILPSRPETRPERVATPLRQLSRTECLAHDARNALTSLELIAGLIAEPGVLLPAYAQCGSDLQSVARVLRTLVSEMANPGPSSSDKAPEGAGTARVIKGGVRSAGAFLQASTGMLRALAGEKAELYISTENALPALAMSEEALTRVLMNLVKNSSEAMPQGGVIHITARRGLSRTTPAVLIQISDTGEGIPAYALDQIFHPGFSSKGTAADSAGRGLGLAIVRELIEGAGGEIRVASTRRKGTTFELKIPCVELAKADSVLP